MPIQLFQKLGEKEIKLIETNIGLIEALINPMQQNDWVEFLSGGIPKERLEWKGSLQESYYLFNQIRIETLGDNTFLKIHTKNNGLDWVKINKVISTRYGKVQKESKPSDLSIVSIGLKSFLSSLKIKETL